MTQQECNNYDSSNVAIPFSIDAHVITNSDLSPDDSSSDAQIFAQALTDHLSAHAANKEKIVQPHDEGLIRINSNGINIERADSTHTGSTATFGNTGSSYSVTSSVSNKVAPDIITSTDHSGNHGDLFCKLTTEKKESLVGSLNAELDDVSKYNLLPHPLPGATTPPTSPTLSPVLSAASTICPNEEEEQDDNLGEPGTQSPGSIYDYSIIERSLNFSPVLKDLFEETAQKIRKENAELVAEYQEKKAAYDRQCEEYNKTCDQRHVKGAELKEKVVEQETIDLRGTRPDKELSPTSSMAGITAVGRNRTSRTSRIRHFVRSRKQMTIPNDNTNTNDATNRISASGGDEDILSSRAKQQRYLRPKSKFNNQSALHFLEAEEQPNLSFIETNARVDEVECIVSTLLKTSSVMEGLVPCEAIWRTTRTVSHSNDHDGEKNMMERKTLPKTITLPPICEGRMSNYPDSPASPDAPVTPDSLKLTKTITLVPPITERTTSNCPDSSGLPKNLDKTFSFTAGPTRTRSTGRPTNNLLPSRSLIPSLYNNLPPISRSSTLIPALLQGTTESQFPTYSAANIMSVPSLLSTVLPLFGDDKQVDNAHRVYYALEEEAYKFWNSIVLDSKNLKSFCAIERDEHLRCSNHMNGEPPGRLFTNSFEYFEYFTAQTTAGKPIKSIGLKIRKISKPVKRILTTRGDIRNSLTKAGLAQKGLWSNLKNKFFNTGDDVPSYLVRGVGAPENGGNIINKKKPDDTSSPKQRLLVLTRPIQAVHRSDNARKLKNISQYAAGLDAGKSRMPPLHRQQHLIRRKSEAETWF